MAGDSMRENTADGDFGCYVARPQAAGSAPAVVVLQEIFGINGFVRATADRLAAQGYLAVAPDLFWRIEPGIDITDQTEAEMKRAFELYGLFDLDKGMEDIAATIEAVRLDPACNGKVGAMGFCLGGLLAFLTATRTSADASVSYYGVGIDKHVAEVEGPTAPLLLHIAGDDKFVPAEAQERIVAALKDLPNVEIHRYPGRDHAFAREGGEHYDAADAATAHARSAAFLARTLR